MLSRNPDYLVHLISVDPPCSIVANIPEQIAMSLSSSWENRFPSSVVEVTQGMGDWGRMAAQGAAATGYNMIAQSATRQTYISGTPTEFNLTLLFDAESSAFQEVTVPAMEALKLIQPYRTELSEALMPPGPSLIDQSRGEVSIRIGQFIFLDSVLITTAGPTFEMRLAPDGHPIAAQIEVTIRSTEIQARDDVERMFGVVRGQQSSNYL